MRRRSVAAALVLIGISISFSLSSVLVAAPTPTPTPVPLTSETLATMISEHKVTPEQAKLLQMDLNYVADAKQKLADFMSQVTPAQMRIKSNQLKYDSLQRTLHVAQQKLALDQAKLTAPPVKPKD